MKHNLNFFSLLFFIGLFAQGQNQSFSLNEAIDYALKNNRTALNAAKDIEAAKKQKWETTASGLPQINAKIDYQYFLKQQVSLIPAEAFGGPPGQFEEVTFGTKQNLNASATLTQKIFDGSYIVGLQSAKVYLDISKNAKIKTDIEIKKAVINAYTNVLLAEESLLILNKNKSLLDANINETQKLIENGFEEEESVEQLQITLSSLTSNINKTQRLKTLAYQMLNITLGIDLNTPTTLTDTLEALTLQHINLGLISESVNANQTIDYQIAENNKTAQSLLLKLQRSRALPSLSAFINGGYAGYSNAFTFTQKSQQWFGSSLFGLSLDIPIFSSFARSATVQRMKINLEKAENDLINTEQNLTLAIEKAKNNYVFAVEELNNKKKNLNLAERIEHKNETKFFEGINSSFNLRQAQTQLYSSQQEYLQSMLNVITAKAELESYINNSN